MKTSKLKIEYDFDFIVFAIVSSSKSHKLAWDLNKALSLQFKKADDLIYQFIKEGRILITNYVHKTEYNCLRLLKNKSVEFYDTTKPFLLPELKEYDYLIQMAGEMPFMESDLFEEKIRSVLNIEYVKKINIENLKSKENLIF